MVNEIYILLACYNGAEFLKSQIDSLLRQTHEAVVILANDDGSSDETLEILNYYKEVGVIRSISQTKRIGHNAAFCNLLEQVPDGAYAAFCDQDDVWAAHKLQRALESLNQIAPQLFFSRREYIDVRGEKIGLSPRVRKNLTVRNSLIENLAYGNTIVLNPAGVAFAKLNLNTMGRYIDFWLYSLFLSTSKVSYSNEVLVSYRIHPKNTIGIKSKKSFRTFSKVISDYYDQAFLLLPLKPLMSVSDSHMFQRFLHIDREPNPSKKILDVIKLPVWRHSIYDTLLFKAVWISHIVRLGIGKKI